MKRIALSIAAAVAAFVLPSCLQNHSTITVNKDGSATIVEETTLSTEMASMMGAFGGEENAKDPFKELASEDKAKERAAKLGEGVSVEKIEPIEADGRKGARVTYKVADINKLKYSGSMEALNPEAAGADAGKAMTFKFEDGTLTITNPESLEALEKEAGDKDEAAAAEAEGNAEEAAQAEQMAKAMLSDMKVSLKIKAASGIEETNATHRDGDTITLMSMDMGKVLDTPGVFAKMQNQDNPAAAAKALKNANGVKVEEKEKVTIKVK